MEKWTDWVLVLMFPLILLAIMAYYNINAFRQWQLQNRLIKGGETTTAQVISKETIPSTKGATSYLLTVSYRAGSDDGKKLSNEIKVGEQIYRLYSEGSELDIIYDPDAPENCDIEGNTAIANNIWLVIVLDIVIFGFLLFAFIRYR